MTSLLQLLEQPTAEDVVVVPVDPESLDATRPVDLDDCPRCMGDGLVYEFVRGEASDITCPACAGSGQRGVW